MFNLLILKSYFFDKLKFKHYLFFFFKNLIFIYPIILINVFITLNSVDKLQIYYCLNQKKCWFSFFFLLNFSTFLRFKSCVELSIVDCLSSISRFTVFYVFLSVLNKRLLIEFKLFDFLKLWSMHTIFYSTNWLERETYDMFGIYFLNHPNLRKILTDYGFKGYPLRKDFSTIGYLDLYYSSYYKKLKHLYFL